MTTVKFEDLLAKVDSGPWRWIVFVLCSIWGLFGAMQAVSAVFLAAPTPHWCRAPVDLPGWTAEQVKNVTVPWNDNQQRYSSCERYVRNYSAMEGRDFSEVWPDMTADAPVVPCESWHYDTSVFRSTVITEWSLVCSRHSLRSLVQSVFMAGVFVGAPFNGYLADRFGRKRVLSVALLVFLTVAVLGALVPWFIAYLVCRFFMAISGHCVYQTSYIIAVETCSIRQRGTVGILFSVPFALGYILLPGIAYLVRDWRLLHLAISMPVVLLIANIILLPESPRWLITRGRREAAAEELQRAARWNRQQPLDGAWLDNAIAEIHAASNTVVPISKGRHSGGDTKFEAVEAEPDPVRLSPCASCREIFCNAFMLRITLVLGAVWFTCTLVYYGISMNSVNFSADPFLYTVLGGLVELPCYLFGGPIVRRLGRRLTLTVALLVTGAAILAPLGVSSAEKTSWWFLAVVMVGKMAVTAGYQVLYLYTSELYPTSIRTQGLGVASMIGRCGAIVAPFITDNLGGVYWALPSLIFGLVSAVTGCLTCALPETRTQALPNTVQEMQAWHNSDRTNKSLADTERHGLPTCDAELQTLRPDCRTPQANDESDTHQAAVHDGTIAADSVRALDDVDTSDLLDDKVKYQESYSDEIHCNAAKDTK